MDTPVGIKAGLWVGFGEWDTSVDVGIKVGRWVGFGEWDIFMDVGIKICEGGLGHPCTQKTCTKTKHEHVLNTCE